VFDYEVIGTHIVRYLAIAGVGGLAFSIARDSAKGDSSHELWLCCKAFFAGGTLTFLVCAFSGWMFPALTYDKAASEGSQIVALLVFGGLCSAYGAHRARR
jgi:hypothetical protein